MLRLFCLIALMAFAGVGVCRADDPSADTAPSTDDGNVVLKFRDADILSVLEFYARLTGDVYVPGPDVKGLITLISPDPVTNQQAIGLLDGILAMQGYSLVRTADYVRVVKSEAARHIAAGPVTAETPPDRIATEIFTLQHVKSAVVQEEIQPFLSSSGTITSGKSGNAVIIRDTADHLNMIRAFVQTLDSASNAPLTKVYRLHYADPSTVAKALEAVTKNMVDDSGINTILITPVQGTNATAKTSGGDTVDAPVPTGLTPTRELLVQAPASVHTQIALVIEELDRQPVQILIEAKLIEVNHEKTNNFGFNIQWLTDSDVYSALSMGNVAEKGSKLIADGGLNYQFLTSDESLQLRTALYEKDTGVRLLSAPHLISLDGQTATMHIGKDVPVLTDIRYDQNNQPIKSYNYKKVGVNMVVTPRVTNNNQVVLDINQKVSDILSSDPNSENYIFESREARTIALLKEGHTLVIGGLIREKQEVIDSGVAKAKDTPVLGWLFRDSYSSEPESEELILLLTPTLLDSTEKADEVTRQKQEAQTDYYEMTGEEFRL